MSASEEVKATDNIHIGCGGRVLVSLDGEVCVRCGAELREEDWFTPSPPPPGATLDELRVYAEHLSQKSGTATVIVAVGGSQHEYVVPSGARTAYTDDVVGALVESLRQRQAVIRAA